MFKFSACYGSVVWNFLEQDKTNIRSKLQLQLELALRFAVFLLVNCTEQLGLGKFCQIRKTRLKYNIASWHQNKCGRLACDIECHSRCRHFKFNFSHRGINLMRRRLSCICPPMLWKQNLQIFLHAILCFLLREWMLIEIEFPCEQKVLVYKT